MMRQRISKDVKNVIDISLGMIARSVIVFFGAANIIGIVWFIGTIGTDDIVRGSIFSFSSFIIGLSPLAIFQSRIAKKIYAAICLIGILSTIYLCGKIIFEEYGGLYDLLEQFVIIACFAFMMVRASKTKIERL